MTLLVTEPKTRVNDRFIYHDNEIDGTIISSNFDDEIIKGLSNIDHRFQAKFYKKIGVDIVTETVFNYPYPFITEKTYRSFASLRPCIILGPYGSLQFLQHIGFKTFSNIINEKYDNIKNPELRFIAVCNSIKDFVDRPIDRIKQDLYNIKDILKFNQTHLLNLTTIQQNQFVKDLCFK
jgi:hypothetical protein